MFAINETNWLRKHWLRIVLWLLVLLPLAGLVLANAVLMIYLFWPKSYDAIDFTGFKLRQSHAIVMAHGVADTTASWIDSLIAGYREQAVAADLFAIDWRDYAGNPLRCAIDGGRIGWRIGEQLARSAGLHSVQLIGHSCGGFVIYNVCRALRENNPQVRVQTTYLDPVSIYGPVFRYGVHRFGDCADYSEAYIDTGDDVAGSNELLPHTHTYDVTAARILRDSKIYPHVWPTIYYQELVSSGRALTMENTPNLEQRKPRGVLEKVAE